MAAAHQNYQPPPPLATAAGEKQEGVGRENVSVNCLFTLIARVKRRESVRVCQEGSEGAGCM